MPPIPTPGSPAAFAEARETFASQVLERWDGNPARPETVAMRDIMVAVLGSLVPGIAPEVIDSATAEICAADRIKWLQVTGKIVIREPRILIVAPYQLVDFSNLNP